MSTMIRSGLIGSISIKRQRQACFIGISSTAAPCRMCTSATARRYWPTLPSTPPLLAALSSLFQPLQSLSWPRDNSINHHCRRRHNYFSSSSSSTTENCTSTSNSHGDANSQQFLMGSSLSRLLTDDQRSLLSRVHQLSSTSRLLARQVGNVPVREDSLLADIARLQEQQQQRRHQRQRPRPQPPEQEQQQQQRYSQNNTHLGEKSDATNYANELAYENTSGNNSTDIHKLDSVIAPPSLFTVVFAGEFNSGKSTLINALLGKELVEAGVLPTTDAITVLMASSLEEEEGNEHEIDASSTAENNDSFDGLTVGTRSTASFVPNSSSSSSSTTPNHTQLHLLPSSQYPILSDLCLIDTPGTNAILSLQHTSSTLRILHDADLIVFVTSADRPFSESEKELLRTSIKSYRKRVVMVINKMDVLERQAGEDHGEKTKQRVMDYVVEHAGDLLGARPVVIPVSARDALSVKLLYSNNTGDGTNNFVVDQQRSSTLWKRSNFAALEDYLLQTLTATTKIKTKLLNPLGVAEGILLDCQSEIDGRMEELEVDVMTLRLLTSQTEAWEKELQMEVMDRCRLDLRQAWEQRANVVNRVLEEMPLMDQWKLMTGRGAFDRVWESANQRGFSLSSSISRDGQNSLERELLSIVDNCAETLASRAKSQGDATMEYLGKRPAIIGYSSSKGSTANIAGSGINRMVGSVKTPKFQRLKEELQFSMTSAIQTSAAHLPDDSQCADRAYSSLRRTILFSTLLCGSAMCPAALTFLEVLDATSGILSSTTLLTLGLVALPLGNRHAAQSFQKEWMAHATKLDTALDTLLNDALRRVGMQLSESVSPYSRYVKTEGEYLKDLNNKMESGMASSHSLRSQINKSCDT